MTDERPLITNPEIAANIHRLAEQTGMPIARYEQWLQQPAPEGMNPDLWRSALAISARSGRPWPEAKLRELAAFAETTEDTSAEDAA